MDGTTYNFLGVPNVPGTQSQEAVQKSLEVRRIYLSNFTGTRTYALEQFTSTQSIFVLTAGPIDLTVSFLSPVEVASVTFLSIPHLTEHLFPAEQFDQSITSVLLSFFVGGCK